MVAEVGAAFTPAVTDSMRGFPSAAAAGPTAGPSGASKELIGRGMDTVLQDIKIGWRLLARRPGFAAMAIVTLALGIGGNTAVFTVVNTVLLRPLPYPDSEGLLRVSEQRPFGRGPMMSILTNETYHAWRERTRTIESLAAYAPRAYTLTGAGDARSQAGASVSAALFPMLRARPALGRLFTEADERPGANRLVILSYQAWGDLFANDPRAVGRTITLDGHGHEVVGVMAAAFYFPDREAAIWTPHFVPPPSRGPERNVFAFSALARLKPGVDLEQAQAEGATVVKGLFEDAPRARTPFDPVRTPDLRLIPLKDEMTREVRPGLLVLAGVIALVLLVATANLANLLLARGVARRREMAIRSAIGAGRGRLVRQLLTESVLLSLLGGGAGLVLAWWLQRALPSVAPADFPRLGELAIDRTVLLFAVAVSVGTGMLFGLAPVAQGLRIDLSRALSAAGDGSGGFRFARGDRARLALAIGEIAVTVVLLVGAGLLLESFRRLMDVHPGYDPRNVMTARLALPQASYAAPGASAEFVDRVLERLAGRPEVIAAASAGTLPLGRGMMVVAFDLPNRPPTADQGPATAAVRPVSPGYLRAMGLRLVDGRWLTDADARGERRVILVNESFVRTYLPGEKVVGRELPVFDRPSEVIGIVGDVRHAGLDAEPQPEVYVSHRHSETVRSMGVFMVIRTSGDPTAVVPALRAAVKSVDPNVPLDSVMTMEARLSASVARPRFYAMLLVAFATLALTLASVGVYGILSYSVSQRRREIGVRMAVGAEARDVLRLVLGQGAGAVAVGLVLGLGAAAVAARALSGLLFGVTARDPAVFAGVTVLLGSIALVACYVPAHRAARVDPLEALREE